MQRKLFCLLFFIFIFSFITTTFSSTEKNEKRKRFSESFDNTLKTEDTNNFNIPSSTDILKNTEEESSLIPFDLLNKLLETSNVFRFIFPYLSLFDLELNVKCASTTFYHLHKKLIREEKTFLQSCLKNEKEFTKNAKHSRQYFDFFEKRIWGNPERLDYTRIEYANVDSFSENLVVFPKHIRQIISFKNGNIQYKYVLFKNGHLSILKQNKKGKFVFTCLEKDFKNFNRSFFGQFENGRWLDVTGFFQATIFIDVYQNDNLKQSIRHSINYPKIKIHPPDDVCPKVFLKNISGFLKQNGTSVHLYKFENHNGTYIQNCIYNFKLNVKEIKSKDFEHYAEEVQFIYN